MKLSHTMGMTGLATILAASGIASADTAAKNTYYAPSGVIVTATDGAGGAVCSALGQKVGNTSNAWFFYPGAVGSNFTLTTPSTPATATKAGSQLSYTCRAGEYVTTSKTVKGVTTKTTKWVASKTAADLNGSNLPFTCFADSAAGAGDGGNVATVPNNPIATVTIAFTVAPTAISNGTGVTTTTNALTAATTEVLSVPGFGACTYETDSTWFAR